MRGRGWSLKFMQILDRFLRDAGATTLAEVKRGRIIPPRELVINCAGKSNASE